MAHTPQTKGLSSLLSSINQGLNNLVGRGGPVLEDYSSVESEAPNMDDKCKRLLGLPGQR